MTDALQRLVDLASHQLRNPMQAIVVNLEVLRLRTARANPDLWEELEPYARGIEEAVRHLETRTELLVRLARAERAEARAVAPAALLEDIITTAGFHENPRVVVEDRAEETVVRAPGGRLIEILFRLLLLARRESRDEIRIVVGMEGTGEARISVPVEGTGDEEGPAWRALEEAAERAGMRVEREPEGRVVLALPVD